MEIASDSQTKKRDTGGNEMGRGGMISKWKDVVKHSEKMSLHLFGVVCFT